MNNKTVRHVAVIMDGNRRWAKLNGLDPFDGHRVGSDNIRQFLDMSLQKELSHISVYAFSSENWARSTMEISYLKDLILRYLRKEKDFFLNKAIRFQAIGNYHALGEEIVAEIAILEDLTKNFTRLTFIVALNYGARGEIIRAVNLMMKDASEENAILQNIDEKMFSRYLYTKDIPDPDFMIRTGGEYRLSNFLLWQLSYSELIFFDVMWPDFCNKHFEEAFKIFYSRERRYGS